MTTELPITPRTVSDYVDDRFAVTPQEMAARFGVGLPYVADLIRGARLAPTAGQTPTAPLYSLPDRTPDGHPVKCLSDHLDGLVRAGVKLDEEIKAKPRKLAPPRKVSPNHGAVEAIAATQETPATTLAALEAAQIHDRLEAERPDGPRRYTTAEVEAITGKPVPKDGPVPWETVCDRVAERLGGGPLAEMFLDAFKGPVAGLVQDCPGPAAGLAKAREQAKAVADAVMGMDTDQGACEMVPNPPGPGRRTRPPKAPPAYCKIIPRGRSTKYTAQDPERPTTITHYCGDPIMTRPQEPPQPAWAAPRPTDNADVAKVVQEALAALLVAWRAKSPEVDYHDAYYREQKVVSRARQRVKDGKLARGVVR